MKIKKISVYVFIFSLSFLVGCSQKQIEKDNYIQTGSDLTGTIDLTGNIIDFTGENITGVILTGKENTDKENTDMEIKFDIQRVENTFEIKIDLTNFDPEHKIKKIGVIACTPNFSMQKDQEYFLQKYEWPKVLYRIADHFQNLCSMPYVFNFYTETGEKLYSESISIENDFFKLAKYHYNILSGLKMERIKNDFFGFRGTEGVKIMGPQSVLYQPLFGGDIAFKSTNGLHFIFYSPDGQLFFTDKHGVQRYIYIPLKLKKTDPNIIGAVVGRISETLTQNKMSDFQYQKLIKEKYPTYKKPTEDPKKKQIEGKEKIDMYFYKDDKNVYLDGYVVVGLDPNTAESLGFWYIKDDKNVFRGPTKIEGADPETFVAIDGLYAKDKNHVYVEDKIFKLGEPSTFKKLDSQYYLDKNHVYFGGTIVEGVDPETFHRIINPKNLKVRLDKNYIYSFGKKIPDSDASSLEFLDNVYAKDNNNIYKFNGNAFYKEKSIYKK